AQSSKGSARDCCGQGAGKVRKSVPGRRNGGHRNRRAGIEPTAGGADRSACSRASRQVVLAPVYGRVGCRGSRSGASLACCGWLRHPASTMTIGTVSQSYLATYPAQRACESFPTSIGMYMESCRRRHLPTSIEREANSLWSLPVWA